MKDDLRPVEHAAEAAQQPQGVNVLPHLPPLESFEIFTGRGWFTKRNWAFLVEEEEWTII